MAKTGRRNLIYHIVCIAFLIGSLLCSIFIFPKVFFRFIDGWVDIGTSAAYYAVEMVSRFSGKVNPIGATVIEIPENAISLLPWTWEEFCQRMELFWELLFSADNLSRFGYAVADWLYWFALWATLLLPFFFLFFILAYRNSQRVNTDYNKDTKPLKVFKWLEAHTYRPMKQWVMGLIAFLKEGKKKYYAKAAVLLWLYNLNLITIILEAFAFLLYFVSSFDMLHVYTQAAKLFLDLSVSFTVIPLPILTIGGWILFDKIRIHIAKKGRKSREKVNREFCKTLAIIVLIIGTTGKKKTTMLADISLSKEVEYREQALSAIQANELKFPNFPWINLTRTIELLESRHVIYNWASCRRFIRFLRAMSAQSGDPAVRKSSMRHLHKYYGYAYPYKNFLFDYDVETYGNTFDNSLYIDELYDVLENYAQEYYLYRLPSSLIMGNLPVRSRIKWENEGNFPEMDADFFDRKSADIPKESQYSHILDYDCFRPGKLFKPDNPQAGAFEFGVADFDEWAKDRGNQKTNAGMERKSDLANPNNDEFNLDMKTRRQSAMVDNEVYLTMIGTEQRASSMNADLLELCDILDIGDKFTFEIGIPLYRVEILINELFQALYSKWWKNEKKNHGNNSLFKYIITGVYNAWWRRYLRRLNEFGYFKGTLLRTLAGTSGKVVNAAYYLQIKKVYAKTFASDTFGAYYQKKAASCNLGLNDLPTYADVRQTIEEMTEHNSYYVEKLNATFGIGQRRK